MNDLSIGPRTNPFWFGNTRVAIRVPSHQGIDGICVIEHWMSYGESPPLHIHLTEDELFHVIDGVMRIEVAGKARLLRKGETLLAPKGVPHSFRVESSQGAHCLTVTRGADFETMVRQAGRPATDTGMPAAVAPTPERIAMLTEFCAANNIEIVGPPLS